MRKPVESFKDVDYLVQDLREQNERLKDRLSIVENDLKNRRQLEEVVLKLAEVINRR